MATTKAQVDALISAATITDTQLSGTNWTDLTDGGATTLHSHAGGGGMSVVIKTADETVSNSATLQNDDVLLFAVGANEKWQFEGLLLVESTATADFKMQCAGPTASVGAVAIEAGLETDTAQYNYGAALTTDIVIPTGANQNIVRIQGAIANGANAGNLTLKWAQNSAEVSNTKVLAGSYLKYQQQV